MDGEQKSKKILTEELRAKLRQLDLFPGSLDEYTSLKSEQYEIMDTGTPENFVYFNPRWLDKNILNKLDRPEGVLRPLIDLVEAGCEALIRYTMRGYGDSTSASHYGIPVRRKIRSSDS
jgi:hypothetical protein